MFPVDILESIKTHALAEHPRESCGVVVGAEYIACRNEAENPEKDFRIPTAEYSKYARRVKAIIHSHTNGKAFPSKADMQSQIATKKPWGIVVTDGAVVNDFFYFGDGSPVPPLIGRQFRHGVTDCYALVRDWYKQEQGIVLPAYARADQWWEAGESMLVDFFSDCGFEVVQRVSEPGDCVIGRVLGKVPNHCGVYIGNDLVLHHLSNRLSRSEPLQPWMKYVTHCLRYVGKSKKRVRKKR